VIRDRGFALGLAIGRTANDGMEAFRWVFP